MAFPFQPPSYPLFRWLFLTQPHSYQLFVWLLSHAPQPPWLFVWGAPSLPNLPMIPMGCPQPPRHQLCAPSLPITSYSYGYSFGVHAHSLPITSYSYGYPSGLHGLPPTSQKPDIPMAIPTGCPQPPRPSLTLTSWTNHSGVVASILNLETLKATPRDERDDILAELKKDYQRLGFPGRNRKFLQVVKEVEIEQSRNSTFELIECGTVIKCGTAAVYIPSSWNLLKEVKIHEETQVPYMMSATGEAVPCMTLFQNPRDYDETGSAPKPYAIKIPEPECSPTKVMSMSPKAISSLLPGMQISGMKKSESSESIRIVLTMCKFHVLFYDS